MRFTFVTTQQFLSASRLWFGLTASSRTPRFGREPSNSTGGTLTHEVTTFTGAPAEYTEYTEQKHSGRHLKSSQATANFEAAQRSTFDRSIERLAVPLNPDRQHHSSEQRNWPELGSDFSDTIAFDENSSDHPQKMRQRKRFPQHLGPPRHAAKWEHEARQHQ